MRSHFLNKGTLIIPLALEIVDTACATFCGKEVAVVDSL
jgi:hypothetical protein